MLQVVLADAAKRLHQRCNLGLEETHLCAKALLCPTAFRDDARSGGLLVSWFATGIPVIAVNMQIAPQTKHTVTASRTAAAMNSLFWESGGAGHCLGRTAGWIAPGAPAVCASVLGISVTETIGLLVAGADCWGAAPVSAASQTYLLLSVLPCTCSSTGLHARQESKAWLLNNPLERGSY